MVAWRSRKGLLRALGVAASVAMVGCLSGGDSDPLDQLVDPPPGGGGGAVQVTMTSNNTFAPSEVTVDPGQVITFINEITTFHTLTPDGHMDFPRREFRQAGENFNVALPRSGTYQYFCEPHRASGMTGVIRVR